MCFICLPMFTVKVIWFCVVVSGLKSKITDFQQLSLHGKSIEFGKNVQVYNDHFYHGIDPTRPQVGIWSPHIVLHIIAIFPDTCIVFIVILRKTTLKFTPYFFLSYISVSGIVFYVSYIHSRTMYLVPKTISTIPNTQNRRKSTNRVLEIRW